MCLRVSLCGNSRTNTSVGCKTERILITTLIKLRISTLPLAVTSVFSLPDSTKIIVTQAIVQLQAIEETLSALKKEMHRLASVLPEYETVMSMYGVGEVLGPQLIAEIGDVTRFKSKKSLVAFAGIDSPADQSGQVDNKSKAITKRGSASLRKTLF